MKAKCYGGIPCPNKKPYTCCYTCNNYENCDFEDKCELSPDDCGNEEYEVMDKLAYTGKTYEEMFRKRRGEGE